jgi:hypothetical protein
MRKKCQVTKLLHLLEWENVVDMRSYAGQDISIQYAPSTGMVMGFGVGINNRSYSTDD